MKYQASLIVNGKLVDDNASEFVDSRADAEQAGRDLIAEFDPERVKREPGIWLAFRIDEFTDEEAAELGESQTAPEPPSCEFCPAAGGGCIVCAPRHTMPRETCQHPHCA